MDIKELSTYLRNLPEKMITGAADIVADTATKEFVGSFRKKSFDGNPWAPAKHPRSNGSLMVNSARLRESIKPITIDRERVVIRAGNPDNKSVRYAKTHNDGFVGTVNVPSHTRGEHQVKAHSKKQNIPKRQFMGNSREINQRIHKDVEDYVKSFFKKK